MKFQPIQLSAYTAISAVGYGQKDHMQALLNRRHGLSMCDFEDCHLETYIGRIAHIESVKFKESHLQPYLCRNNQIAYAALKQDNFSKYIEKAKKHYGSERLGVIVGTSTSGFSELEHAYQKQLSLKIDYKKTVDFSATAYFIADLFAIKGPVLTISTACSSSAKIFISAARMLLTNLCDAVIVAGVDSLCLNILYGFNSLELLAKTACKPCDINRQGLSLGEAGACFLLEKSTDKTKIQLLGYGESTDSYHMSTPHPDGIGAKLAMQSALDISALRADEIDYINMHGTASKINDSVEAKAIHAVFGNKVAASSTKGWTGHTLGASGALEAFICCLALENNLIPGCINSKIIDPKIKANIRLENSTTELKHILTNSFGFGGNNCSLILGKNDAL